ncbi:MAG: NFACT family protein [Lachnospiraceae bacterium]|nr:NFACT family protein [Lachnospiraceae bacterium]
MAFDGIAVAAVTRELNDKLLGGRVYKIAQPEEDELLITVKNNSSQYMLSVSANPSLPLIYLTENKKPSPITAPAFCMLLRKYILNGRIVAIFQPGLERIVRITVEHLDEMGDMRQKTLIAEIMGKHSNIIFVNEDNVIIDSIKRINASVSSVREVLPGRDYFVPNTDDKQDALKLYVNNDSFGFKKYISSGAKSLFKAIYTGYTGFSPLMASEICYEASLDADVSTASLGEEHLERLWRAFYGVLDRVVKNSFSPCIVFSGKVLSEFSALELRMFSGAEDSVRFYDSMSNLLESFYAQKSTYTRIRQKSADLRKLVSVILERTVKKYDLQLKQMEDTSKRETYRIYGELINAFGYGLDPGSEFLECDNYYDNSRVRIPLDKDLSPKDNAKRYFDKYNKMKRTYEALKELTQSVLVQKTQLEEIMCALDLAQDEADLNDIKKELIISGFIKNKGNAKLPKAVNGPLHFLSSDGFDIFVGKNNLQNDELTFKLARGNDWWFHAKNMPGSHVILKAVRDREFPDRAFEEAAALAAFFSKGREMDKVEVDYVLKKEVKKPSGAVPGFVVYYTNFSMVIAPDISGLSRV